MSISPETAVSWGLVFAALYAAYRYGLRPFYQRRILRRWIQSPKIQTAFHIVANCYADIDGAELARQDRAALGLDEFNHVYGEMPFMTFAALLETIALPPGGIFYDLGSGTGKIVVAASVLHDFTQCIGIERLPSLYACSSEVQQQLADPRVIFLEGDYATEDLSLATLVYLNATGVFDDVWPTRIAQLQQLKPNAWVIVTSKKLPETSFELIDARERVMSWGMNRVFVYRRLAEVAAS